VVNDGVNVGDLRLYHYILLVENERDSGLIGVVVLRGALLKKVPLPMWDLFIARLCGIIAES
jgi:hypothetical protein